MCVCVSHGTVFLSSLLKCRNNAIHTSTQLWRKKCRTSGATFESVIITVKDVRHSKVGDLDASVLSHQQVFWLDITMDDAVLVHYK